MRNLQSLSRRENIVQSRVNRRRLGRPRKAIRSSIEPLEGRTMLSSDFLVGLGGRSPLDLRITANDVDRDGNSYVTGYFNGTVDFDPSAQTFNLSSRGGSDDIFVAKYSPSGEFIWAERFGGDDGDRGLGIAIDDRDLDPANWIVYLSGRFEGSADFGPFDLQSAGDRDGFFARLDQVDEPQAGESPVEVSWVRGRGGEGDDLWDQKYGPSIDFDSTGDLFVTGNISVLPPPPKSPNKPPPPALAMAMYVDKLDPDDGSIVWSKEFPPVDVMEPDKAVPHAIAVDDLDNVYVGGWYTGSVVFGGQIETAPGGADIFVAKLDSSTGDSVWIQTMGGEGSQQLYDLAIDPSGDVVLAGHYRESFTVGGTPLLNSGSSDILLAKLASGTGAVSWIHGFGGPENDRGEAITVDENGHIFVVGGFHDTVDFDPDPVGTFLLTAYSYADIFIGHFDGSGNFVNAWKISGTDDWTHDNVHYFTDPVSGGPSLYLAGDLYNPPATFPNGAVLTSGHDFLFRFGGVLPTLAVDDLVITEGDGGSSTATFTVSVAEAPGAQVVVDYSTVDGTATAGSDYAAVSGSLTFGPGEPLSRSITVNILGDTTDEADERFSLNLSLPTGETIFGDNLGVATILDDDGPATVTHTITTSLPIPDRSTVTSTITVPESGSILDVNVTLHIDHTWDEDLDVFLISPTGTRIELFTDVGGSGYDFRGTTLDDEAADPITSGSAPFTGSYRPEGSLADLDGETLSGIWTLEITDDHKWDVGALGSWSLEITYQASGGSSLPASTTDWDAGPGSDAEPLHRWQLRFVLGSAMAYWREAGADLSRLGRPDIRVADHPDTTIGRATITLDRDAAGHGWFFDPSPADTSNLPGDHLDLITAVAHEIDHALDLDHDLEVDGDEVMAPVLGLGERRISLEPTLNLATPRRH